MAWHHHRPGPLWALGAPMQRVGERGVRSAAVPDGAGRRYSSFFTGTLATKKKNMLLRAHYKRQRRIPGTLLAEITGQVMEHRVPPRHRCIRIPDLIDAGGQSVRKRSLEDAQHYAAIH